MEVFLVVVGIIETIYEITMVSGIHREARRNNISLSIGGAFFYFIFSILTLGIYSIYWLYKADECISYEYRNQNKHYRECHPIAWYLFGSLIIVGPFIAFAAIKNRYSEIGIVSQNNIQVEILNTLNASNTKIGNNNLSNIYDDQKKCPFCAETIKKEAIICRFCGRDLPKEEPKSSPMSDSNNSYNRESYSSSNSSGNGSNKKCRSCRKIFSGSYTGCPHCGSSLYEELNSPTNVSPIAPKMQIGDTWICKKCWEENSTASSFCKGCGEYK